MIADCRLWLAPMLGLAAAGVDRESAIGNPQFLLALPWFLPFLLLFRLARHRPTLRDPALQPPEGPDAPLVSVIIPARNEAETIATAVSSILATRYQRMELLVVDDRSTDATAAIVEPLARRDVRVRLLRGAELPEGWYGKPWACHQGFRAARGDLLLFTDADTRHEPELLGRAVAALLQIPADLVTVAPRQLCGTVWERWVMPQIVLLLGVRYHPSVVNRARRARDVIANGQFVLFRRAAYEQIGGHESVRQEVAEDLALAQRAWRAGLKLHFAFAETLMQTRMYRGLRHLIEGWSKNIYLGGRRSYPEDPLLRALVPLGLVATMLFWLLPPLALLAGLAGRAPLQPALVATGASLAFWTMIAVGMRIRPWSGLGYPVGALLALYIVLRSTLRGAGRVEWKGRTYGSSINTGAGRTSTGE